MRIIGEAQQQWAPLRRKYNLFLLHQPANTETSLGTHQITSGDLPRSSSQQLQVSEAVPAGSSGEYNQFASVDEPFLSWDFSLRSAESRLIGSVNRNWGGIGRELFTDTGVYALRMDAAGLAQQPQLPGSNNRRTDVIGYDEKSPGMTLDQRAVMLATAVSIDFDYFSRHSGAGGGMGWMPLWFPIGGGEAAAAGEAAEGAGAAGAATEGSVIREADLARPGAVGDGTVTGVGTMAGYEAMQKGDGRDGANEGSPTAAHEGIMEDEGARRNGWGAWDGSGDSVNDTPNNHDNKGGGDGGGVDGNDSFSGDGGGGGFDIDDFFG